MADVPFNKQLRKSTREIHSISDALANAKLVFALSSDRVWAEGLLVFYEIFKFLEESMIKHKDTRLGSLHVDGIDRKEAFKQDLDYYLGPGWERYPPRETVRNYLARLNDLEKENPDFLIAYVYHLYMGLLSGGQIMSKKRDIAKKINPFMKRDNKGNAVTDFGEKNIKELKDEIILKINLIADNMSNEEKDQIIKESQTVFILNNQLIKSIQTSNTEICLEIFFAVCVIALAVCYFKYFYGK